MKSSIFAYAFQAVNIAVALLMVPLLLRNLSVADYTLWLLFSAFCGATVQVQSAILGVSTKEISHAFHKGSPDDFRSALNRSRRAYAALSAAVAGPVLIAGAVYFWVTQNAGSTELAGWIALVGSYALVYLFAPNNAVLLATDYVGVNSNINTATRLVFFGGTLLLLTSGLSILAPCLALALSSIVGIVVNTIFARRRITAHALRPPARVSAPIRGSVGQYGFYVFSSFMIYSGALLVFAPLFPLEAASYGFALQTSTLLAAIALVPLQLWLGKLVRATGSEEGRELRRALMVCNLLYVLGYLCLVFIGPYLLEAIGANISLPGVGVMALMYMAFTIELNIYIVANHLTAKGNYTFATRYALVALAGLAVGTFVAWISGVSWLGFLVVPLIVQLSLNVTRIVSVTAAHFNSARTSDV